MSGPLICLAIAIAGLVGSTAILAWSIHLLEKTQRTLDGRD